MEMSLLQKEGWSSQHCALNLCLTSTQQVFLHMDFFSACIFFYLELALLAQMVCADVPVEM